MGLTKGSIVLILTLVAVPAEATWRPLLSLTQTAMMKDAINSRTFCATTNSFSEASTPFLVPSARGGSTRSKTTTVQSDDIPEESEQQKDEIESSQDGQNATECVEQSPALPAPTESPTKVKAISLNVSKKDLKKAQRQARKEKKAEYRYAKKLKNRNHTNLKRKVMHASWGLLFGLLNFMLPKTKFVTGMAVLTSATLVFELLRYRRGFEWMNDTLHSILGSSLRKHEMEGKFTGSFYFFLGVTLTSALYPTTCATLGIFQLAIADPSASFFGRQTRHIYWSRIENGLGGFGRNKGFLGFLGGALSCLPLNYRVLSLAKFGNRVVPKSSLVFVSFALGLAGAFADLAVPTPALMLPRRLCGVDLPPFHVDDNFVVPIFSGYACKKLFQIMDWPVDLELANLLFWNIGAKK
mmetsp:Transcript_39544/g.55724  ORF Transcript_39544/g.55724 Transcript_39544/m.55724 type:complete len:411 (+) Transcript_39544:66-1298(+)